MIGEYFVATAVVEALVPLGRAASWNSHPVTDDIWGGFMVQFIVLLIGAHTCGWVARKLGFPALVGEIGAGILLGPTVLGSLAPNVFEELFRTEPTESIILVGVGIFGVMFQFLDSGLGVDAKAARKRVRPALAIGLIGVAVPFVLGWILTRWFCWATVITVPRSPNIFAAYLALSMSISAMVIITRLLKELGWGKTHMVQDILCAYAVNDVFAWLVFSAIFQFGIGSELSWSLIALKLVLSIAGAIGAVLFCPRWVAVLMRRIDRAWDDRGVIVSAILFGFMLGALTHHIGLTAYFGVFVAGVLMSESEANDERVRQRLSEVVHWVMLPIFFVLLGFDLDLRRNFDGRIVVFVTVASIVLKFSGAYLGAVVSDLTGPREVRKRYQWIPVAISFMPGDVSGIILGSLALQYRIITEPVLLAIIVSTVISSLVTALALQSWTRRIVERIPQKLVGYLTEHNSALSEIKSAGREFVIRELATRACDLATIRGGRAAIIEKLAPLQETEFAFAEAGCAFFHARSRGLTRHIVLFGWSVRAIPWELRVSEDKVLRCDFRGFILLLSPERETPAQQPQREALKTVLTRFASRLADMSLTRVNEAVEGPPGTYEAAKSLILSAATEVDGETVTRLAA